MQFMKGKKIVQRQQNEVGARRQQPRSKTLSGSFLARSQPKLGNPRILVHDCIASSLQSRICRHSCRNGSFCLGTYRLARESQSCVYFYWDGDDLMTVTLISSIPGFVYYSCVYVCALDWLITNRGVKRRLELHTTGWSLERCMKVQK